MIKFWQTKGRINREELIFLTILLFILWLPLFLLTANTSKIFIISSILIFVFYLMQTAKRYHDLNKNGINGFVWFIIPIINIIFFIELYFKKGTDGDNKYGQPSSFRIKDVFERFSNPNSEKENSPDIIFNDSFKLPEDKKHELIYLLEWLVNDGDWIEHDKPIFKLRIGDWISLNSSFASQPIIANRSGFLKIFKQKGELIQYGDRICTIVPQSVYALENSPLNHSYKFHFDYKGYNLANPSSKFIIKSWHKEDGELIKIGDVVLTLSYDSTSPSQTQSIIHYAEKDGYFDKVRNLNEVVSSIYALNQNELVYIICEDDQERINRKFINKPQIQIDDFTKKKVLKWRQVGQLDGYSEGITSKSLVGNMMFTFTFNNIEGYDYLIFQFESKALMLYKDDIVSFLFNDNSIIEFQIVFNSYRAANNPNSKLFENKALITDEQLQHFESKRFAKWKITSKKQNLEIIGGVEGSQQYQAHNNLAIVISKLAKEYRELVRNEIPNYKPLEQESLASLTDQTYDEDCYVYLMIDTTNNHHKIGISNKPEWREKTLQSEKPTIELLASKKFINRKIAASFEKALHETYSNKRIRGEWFLLDLKEIKEIEITLRN